MLTRLQIKNFALIDYLEIDFEPGLTVLTGETGAGKSIIVGALGLALGGRANSDMIRNKDNRAEINLECDISGNESAMRWIRQHDLDSSNQCLLIRRVLMPEERTRAYVNGTPVPVSSLRTLGAMIVDIHGQHEHYSLLKKDVQRQLLDEYGDHLDTVRSVLQLSTEWNALHKELRNISDAGTNSIARREFLQYQIDELIRHQVEHTDIAALEEEHRLAAHAEQLGRNVSQATNMLSEEDDNLLTRLRSLQRVLCESAKIDDKLANSQQLLENALLHLDECVGELRHYASHTNYDEERIQWLDQKLGTLYELARKHRVPVGELGELLVRLQDDLSEIDKAEQRIDEINTRLQKIRDEYEAAAQILSEKRREAGARLGEAVRENLRRLGMPDAVFLVELVAQHELRVAPYGQEQVEFLVSANPGVPPRPLNKVASGGELSRISLAIEVITAHRSAVRTFVFDEVDTGVGGAVAEIIGNQLRLLGKTHQVLCVTHSPQIAAQGHQHLHISKLVAENTTTTSIVQLTPLQRSEEIARMLGGHQITRQSRAHAKEMLQRGQSANTNPEA